MAPVSLVTESIQDTRHVIHPWINQKPVSEKLAERIYLAQVNASIL